MTQPHPPGRRPQAEPPKMAPPRRVDQPSPPPPPRDPTRIWVDETTSESARQNRTDAAYIAVDLLGDCSGTPAGIAARLVELAEPIADWIRDGTRPEPEPEVYHSIHGNPRPPMTSGEFEDYLGSIGDGSRP